MMPPTSLSLTGVCFNYGGNAVLHEMDGDFISGRTTAIVGRSGEGKSTLLSLLGMLIRPKHGSYRVGGVDVAALDDRRRARLRHASFGFVFQDHLMEPAYSLLENCIMPSVVGSGIGVRGRARTRAMELASSLGIAEVMGRRPLQVSGGQRQRAAVIRALVHDPRFVLADEPTGALDPSTAAGLIDELIQLSTSRGVGLVMVTHDMSIAERCDRRVRLIDGSLHDV